MTTDLHYFVITDPRQYPAIDTVISGHDAAHFAAKHRKELIRDCGFASSDVAVFKVPADHADAFEDHVNEGGKLGRKSIAKFNATL